MMNLNDLVVGMMNVVIGNPADHSRVVSEGEPEGEQDYYFEEQRGIKFLQLRSLMMLDWDIPDEISHKTDGCVSIDTREEVITRLESYCEAYPEMLFIVEKTPGGVRAWEVSREWDHSNRNWERVMLALGCDPLYRRLCARMMNFACRVSPKPARVEAGIEDRVAEHWCVIGGGEFCEKLRPQWNAYLEAISSF